MQFLNPVKLWKAVTFESMCCPNRTQRHKSTFRVNSQQTLWQKHLRNFLSQIQPIRFKPKEQAGQRTVENIPDLQTGICSSLKPQQGKCRFQRQKLLYTQLEEGGKRQKLKSSETLMHVSSCQRQAWPRINRANEPGAVPISIREILCQARESANPQEDCKKHSTRAAGTHSSQLPKPPTLRGFLKFVFGILGTRLLLSMAEGQQQKRRSTAWTGNLFSCAVLSWN